MQSCSCTQSLRCNSTRALTSARGGGGLRRSRSPAPMWSVQRSVSRLVQHDSGVSSTSGSRARLPRARRAPRRLPDGRVRSTILFCIAALSRDGSRSSNLLNGSAGAARAREVPRQLAPRSSRLTRASVVRSNHPLARAAGAGEPRRTLARFLMTPSLPARTHRLPSGGDSTHGAQLTTHRRGSELGAAPRDAAQRAAAEPAAETQGGARIRAHPCPRPITGARPQTARGPERARAAARGHSASPPLVIELRQARWSAPALMI